MSTSENDPKQLPENELSEPEAPGKGLAAAPSTQKEIRRYFSLPQWWRELVLSGVPRTQADVDRLADWFAQQMNDSPLDS
jgi:hypothetical protein